MVRLDQTHPVVPECNRIWFPLEANLVVHILSNLVEKKAQDGIRFSFRYANNTTRKPWVHENTLPAGGWVHPNKRMDTFNFLPSDRKTCSPGTFRLGDATVHCFESLKIGLETRTQSGIKCVSVEKNRVGKTYVCKMRGYKRTPKPRAYHHLSIK